MEVKQLRYFVAVAEKLSFTQAAAGLHTAQSTVSAAVRALETDLRVQLLDRSTRNVTLSSAGAAFLPEAKAVIEAVERARAVADATSREMHGSLRIGVLTGVGALDLPGLVGAFKTRHPRVEMEVRMSGGGSAGIAEDVRTGRLDVGVVALDPLDAPGVALRPFARIPYVVVLPGPDHRLATKDRLSLRDLADEDFVDAPRGFGTRITLDRACARLGITRRTRVEVSDIQSVASYVRAISGVAVVPALADPRDTNVVVSPLREPQLAMTLSFCVPSSRPPSRAMAALLELSADYIRTSERY